MSTRPGPFNPGQSIQQALALHQQGRLDEAEKLYARVLKAQRDNFDALHLLGMLNHQRGKAGEALSAASAPRSRLQPRSPDALSNFALVLHALRRSDEALAALDKALAFVPGHLDALNNRGKLLLDLGRPAEAISAFDAVLAKEPRHLQALINRGNARAAFGETEQALAEYDAALAMAPGHPLALFNRGNALRALGREADAIAAYDGALAAAAEPSSAPGPTGAWRKPRSTVMPMRSRATAARWRLQPDNAELHFNAALSLLTIGDYARGFAEYEWRWKRAGMAARKDLRKPLWLGETPLAGKTILLHAEQGLGDTMMFVRYAPLLARAGARVVLEVQPELKNLLSGLDGVDRDCRAGRIAAAIRRALPADQPAAGLQDRSVQRAGGNSLSARVAERDRDMAAAPRGAAVAARRAGVVRPRDARQRPQSLACAGAVEPLLSLDDGELCQRAARACASPMQRCWPREPPHRASRRRARRLYRYRCGAGACRSGDLRRHVGRASGRRARPSDMGAAAVPAGLALDARSRAEPLVSGARACFASRRLATGPSVIARVRDWSLHGCASGSPPCRPTSLRGAAGTHSASRRTAGRRCGATP